MQDIGVQGHRVSAVLLRDHDGRDRRRHLCGEVRHGLWADAGHLENANLMAGVAEVVHSLRGGLGRGGELLAAQVVVATHVSLQDTGPDLGTSLQSDLQATHM